MNLRNINEDYILFDSDYDVERSNFKRDSTGSYTLQPGDSINYERNEETEVFINEHATPASPATIVNDATKLLHCLHDKTGLDIQETFLKIHQLLQSYQ